jgi:hypothetical protein
MKCLLCPAEIDELKAFPPTPGPQGQMIEDIIGKWNHSQALVTWTHVALTAQKGGGSMSILSGHVCPAHPVKPGSVALVAMPLVAAPVEVALPKAAPAGTPPTSQAKPEAVAAPTTQTATSTPKVKEK